ncbi:hypothetical protein AAG570_004693 [Ranatra chinensis]|uniref:Uncharacterized protein n=1 Tax=Ranatra chinensis TaxID=642074 RepID=A0ABD0Y1K9_9HEMI
METAEGADLNVEDVPRTVTRKEGPTAECGEVISSESWDRLPPCVQDKMLKAFPEDVRTVALGIVDSLIAELPRKLEHADEEEPRCAYVDEDNGIGPEAGMLDLTLGHVGRQASGVRRKDIVGSELSFQSLSNDQGSVMTLDETYYDVSEESLGFRDRATTRTDSSSPGTCHLKSEGNSVEEIYRTMMKFPIGNNVPVGDEIPPYTQVQTGSENIREVDGGVDAFNWDSVTSSVKECGRARDETPKGSDGTGDDGAPKSSDEIKDDGTPKGFDETVYDGAPKGFNEAVDDGVPKSSDEIKDDGAPKCFNETIYDGALKGFNETVDDGAPKGFDEIKDGGAPKGRDETLDDGAPKGSDETKYDGAAKGSDETVHDGDPKGSDAIVHDGPPKGFDETVDDGAAKGFDETKDDGGPKGSDETKYDGAAKGSDETVHDGAPKGSDAIVDDGVAKGSDAIVDDGVAKGSDEIVDDGAPKSFGETEDGGASKGSDEIVDDGAPKSFDETVDDGTPKSFGKTEDGGAPKGSDEIVDDGAAKGFDETEDDGASKGSDEIVDDGVPKSFGETEDGGAPKGSDEIIDDGAAKGSDDIVDDGAAKGFDETEDEGASKGSDEIVDYGAPKSFDETVDDGVQKGFDKTEDVSNSGTDSKSTVYEYEEDDGKGLRIQEENISGLENVDSHYSAIRLVQEVLSDIITEGERVVQGNVPLDDPSEDSIDSETSPDYCGSGESFTCGSSETVLRVEVYHGDGCTEQQLTESSDRSIVEKKSVSVCAKNREGVRQDPDDGVVGSVPGTEEDAGNSTYKWMTKWDGLDDRLKYCTYLIRRPEVGVEELKEAEEPATLGEMDPKPAEIESACMSPEGMVRLLSTEELPKSEGSLQEVADPEEPKPTGDQNPLDTGSETPPTEALRSSNVGFIAEGVVIVRIEEIVEKGQSDVASSNPDECPNAVEPKEEGRSSGSLADAEGVTNETLEKMVETYFAGVKNRKADFCDMALSYEETERYKKGVAPLLTILGEVMEAFGSAEDACGEALEGNMVLLPEGGDVKGVTPEKPPKKKSILKRVFLPFGRLFKSAK